eukprot:TRINITY_DN64741_c0_g1_i1.p1 TRINITY_DN64741_c0_g1~~TRINITY_DN64741_c0_g1_i1.p1  ORF type:complete len:292 (+),score=96.25 TRINITY_DN64741_c0_g1_i1:72-878(+)
MAEDGCIQKVMAASVAENEAISLDRSGDTNGAIKKYEECEKLFALAISASLPNHSADHPKLVQHREEVLQRIQHLKSLKGKASTVPVEDQIKAVQLGMQAASAAAGASDAAGGVKTLGAVAAMGAIGGFIVLGSIGLGTAGAVAGAAAAGYTATRSDQAGDVARTAGGVVVAGAEKAMELNREHQITTKVVEAGGKAMETAKTVNDKYHITDKVVAGVKTAASKAQEIEETHHVTSKVAAGISAGLSKLTSALDSAGKAASSSGSGAK